MTLKRHIRACAVAVAGLAGLGVMTWLFLAPLESSESKHTSKSDSLRVAAQVGGTAPPSANTISSANNVRPGAGPLPPPGVSAAQWAQLQAEMAQRPDGAAELDRLAAYFKFTDTAQRFRQLRSTGGDSAQLTELAALARQLDEALPERLRQRELGAGEARQLKAAILEVQIADLGERAQRLQQWQQSLTGTAVPVAAVDTRQNDFLRKQQALVAAWSAQPAALRDPRSLEQQLDALRRSSFPGPTQ